MQRISITNPQNIIDGTAKKYYFKLRNTGGPKGDKGDKGDTGATGPQGPQGNAATVSVGSTTTLPVGYDATVTNSGSIYNAVLDFGIPQGPQGPQGAKGDKGDTGAQGETGPRGPQGERGTNATVYVGTTTTTNPGTQARVYNSGTDSNAVLNFEIPRGDVGPMPTIAQTTGQSTTEVMSQKATTDALNNGLATKQNTLTAGNNITISGNTISAKDTTYTAGNNVQINGTTISATDTTYTAGNGLNLNGTEFSADTDVLATKTDLEGYYTKPETDNLLAPKLETEVVAELPTTGEEGKLYLTPKNYTRGTGTGNPITATITDEAGKIESFQLDGDTYQQTYTGKNLLMNKESAQEKTGITITPNSDGSFTLDGTATTTTDFYFAGSWQNRTISYLDMPSGDYTISLLDSAKQQIASPKFRVELYDRMGENSTRILWLQQSAASPQTTTVSSPAQVTAYYISIPINQSFTNEKFYIQLEKGSAATSFEKYVGGTPSPNPDYPQPIQTVTGLQTVTVEGKNKIKSSTTGSVAWSGTTVTYAGDQITINKSGNGGIGANAYTNAVYTPLSANQAYTFSVSYKSGVINADGSNIWDFYIYTVKSDGSTSSSNRLTASLNLDATNPSASVTFTPSEDFVGFKLGCYIPGGSSTTTGDVVFNAQLEAGSTASSFAPYNATSYPISLGSIELCKLGTYQDYIYENEGKWYLRKECEKKNLLSTEVNMFELSEQSGYSRLYISKSSIGMPSGWGSGIALCSNFKEITTGQATTPGLFRLNVNGNNAAFYIPSSITTLDAAKSYMDALSGSVICYALATPTDTVITDQTLIAQLETIRTASLENGANTITNTATGSNLAGDMEIGYYGYNPTNRYDKFIWLNLDNAYEQLNNPDTSSTLSTLSTRTLGATTEQPTVTRSLETETITLKKGETEPIEDKTELPTILDEEAETSEPEESDGTDER